MSVQRSQFANLTPQDIMDGHVGEQDYEFLIKPNLKDFLTDFGLELTDNQGHVFSVDELSFFDFQSFRETLRQSTDANLGINQYGEQLITRSSNNSYRFGSAESYTSNLSARQKINPNPTTNNMRFANPVSDPATQAKIIKATVVPAFEEAEAQLHAWTTPFVRDIGENRCQLSSMTLRLCGIWLTGRLADLRSNSSGKQAFDNLLQALIPYDQSYSHKGAIDNAILLNNFFKSLDFVHHSGTDAFLKSKNFGGDFGIKAGREDSIADVSANALQLAEYMLDQNPELFSQFEDFEQSDAFQKGPMSAFHATEKMIQTSRQRMEKLDGDDAVFDLLAHFPNPESQAYLYAQIGVDAAAFTATEKPEHLTAEQWQLTQAMAKRHKSYQNWELVKQLALIPVMAILGVGASVFPPLAPFALGAIAASTVGMTAKQVYDTDVERQLTHSAYVTGLQTDAPKLATRQDLNRAESRLFYTVAAAPPTILTAFLGMGASTVATRSLSTTSGRVFANIGIGATEGAITPTYDYNHVLDGTLGQAMIMGAGLGAAGGAFGEAVGVSGRYAMGNKKIVFTREIEIDGTLKSVSLEVPQERVQWSRDGQVGMTHINGEKIYFTTDEVTHGFNMRSETETQAPKPAGGVANHETVFRSSSEAEVQALALTVHTGKEHTIFKNSHGDYFIQEGSARETWSDALDADWTEATHDAHREFFGTPVAHTHPPGSSALPSYGDLLQFAASAKLTLKKGESFTTKILTPRDTGDVTLTLRVENDNGHIWITAPKELNPDLGQNSEHLLNVMARETEYKVSRQKDEEQLKLWAGGKLPHTGLPDELDMSQIVLNLDNMDHYYNPGKLAPSKIDDFNNFVSANKSGIEHQYARHVTLTESRQGNSQETQYLKQPKSPEDGIVIPDITLHPAMLAFDTIDSFINGNPNVSYKVSYDTDGSIIYAIYKKYPLIIGEQTSHGSGQPISHQYNCVFLKFENGKIILKTSFSIKNPPADTIETAQSWTKTYYDYYVEKTGQTNEPYQQPIDLIEARIAEIQDTLKMDFNDALNLRDKTNLTKAEQKELKKAQKIEELQQLKNIAKAISDTEPERPFDQINISNLNIFLSRIRTGNGEPTAIVASESGKITDNATIQNIQIGHNTFTRLVNDTRSDVYFVTLGGIEFEVCEVKTTPVIGQVNGSQTHWVRIFTRRGDANKHTVLGYPIASPNEPITESIFSELL